MIKCDKRNSHIKSKPHMIYIYLLVLIATVFLRPSLHLSTLHFFPFKLHPTTLQYPLILLNPV